MDIRLLPSSEQSLCHFPSAVLISIVNQFLGVQDAPMIWFLTVPLHIIRLLRKKVSQPLCPILRETFRLFLCCSGFYCRNQLSLFLNFYFGVRLITTQIDSQICSLTNPATATALFHVLYISITFRNTMYEGYLESKERFAIQRYLLIIGKKKNMQVLSHTFTYFST